MECEFNHTHIKEDNYSEYKHLTTLTQPRKYSDDIFKMKFGRTSEVLGRLQYSATKSLGACQTQVHRTVHVAYFF
jgi:hypothetical protein